MFSPNGIDVGASNQQLTTINFPILAIGFFAPAFAIAGVLLASIPVIIHILNRRRYKTVEWAAMDFLLRAMKKKSPTNAI